jgi:hypothetical protein
LLKLGGFMASLEHPEGRVSKEQFDEFVASDWPIFLHSMVARGWAKQNCSIDETVLDIQINTINASTQNLQMLANMGIIYPRTGDLADADLERRNLTFSEYDDRPLGARFNDLGHKVIAACENICIPPNPADGTRFDLRLGRTATEADETLGSIRNLYSVR